MIESKITAERLPKHNQQNLFHRYIKMWRVRTMLAFFFHAVVSQSKMGTQGQSGTNTGQWYN